MKQTLFAFNERNYRQCQQAFRGADQQEYYKGEYAIDGGSTVDVRADRKTVGACSIIRMRAMSRQFFRRSWSHIREDATDVTVLWFVQRGALNLRHQCGSSYARAGDFLITQSMSPFSMECETDSSSMHEVMHVVVPTHVFRRFFPQDINIGFTTPIAGSAFKIAEKLFADVYDDPDELTDHVAQALLDCALLTLGDALRDCPGATQTRQSVSDQRLENILRFIEVHLADPKLSPAVVADACGISQRYLSHLLKQKETTFSRLLWDWRLKTAHEWLATTDASEFSIAEVAFRSGFKSPAHFSRMFKRAYQVGPREFRASQITQQGGEQT